MNSEMTNFLSTTKEVYCAAASCFPPGHVHSSRWCHGSRANAECLLIRGRWGPCNPASRGGIHIVQEYAELNGATTGEGAAEILKDRTGVLYFGFPECPWCRISMPVMNEVAQAGDIDQIHYVDARELRDTRVLSEDGDGCHRGPRCRGLR